MADEQFHHFANNDKWDVTKNNNKNKNKRKQRNNNKTQEYEQSLKKKQSLIIRTVSMDVRHHVYLIAFFST